MVILMTATVILAGCTTPGTTAPKKMILATTTSTQDSGLLDFILPKFNSKYNIKTNVIAVGTGQALAYGQTGDADVLLVHSKAKELDFVNKSYGLWRKDVMYNWFIIVGPSDDPAGVKNLNNTVDAFKAIYNTNSTFCTRGDASGTNTKELDLWKKAGLNPDPKVNTWYLNVSQGMGETLNTCNEKKAYTLCDEATWYNMFSNLPNMAVVLQGDKPNLLNQYGVIPVNPANGPHVKSELGLKFANWIISNETQAFIATYMRAGHQLFFPNANVTG
jgi:tungstate transport system substrate-binding protein